jgi:hypothetical protein
MAREVDGDAGEGMQDADGGGSLVEQVSRMRRPSVKPTMRWPRSSSRRTRTHLPVSVQRKATSHASAGRTPSPSHSGPNRAVEDARHGG